MFLSLSACYIIKLARDALVLSVGDAEVKNYASAAQAVLLLFRAVPMYGWLSTQLNLRKLIGVVTVLFVVCCGVFCGVFCGLARAAVPTEDIFFLWVSSYSM